MFTKNLLILLCVIVSLPALAQPIQVRKGPRQKLDLEKISPQSYYPGKIFVKLKPGATLSSSLVQGKTVSRSGIQKLDKLVGDRKILHLQKSFYSNLFTAAKEGQHAAWGFDRWITLEFPASTDIKATIKELEKLTDIVEVAEPSFKRVLYDNDDPMVQWTPADSAYYRQWNYNNTGQEGPTSPEGTDADIDLPEAWELEKGQPNVIVALFDGGVDTSHPDLRGNLWIGNKNERFGYNWYSNSSKLEPNAHGTHTCGTIAAVNNNGIGVSGIAGGDGTANSGVRVMNMQIFTGSGNVYAGDDAVANAFVYSADRGACIAQNSWGGGSSSTLISDAIDYFIMYGGGNVLNGGIVIFSAGNSNSEISSFPADYSPVICVTATNYDDKKSWYSSYGKNVDISAPGGELNVNGSSINGGRKGILSTVPVSLGSYAWNHGTSMACPHVSGVAALCVSKAPGKMTNDQLRALLLQSVDDIYPLNQQYLGKLGSGRINAYLAVKNAAEISAATIDTVSQFKATQSCGKAQLSWRKNANGDNVIIAMSDSLVFGSPVASIAVGDILPGGGMIIYKGAAENYSQELPANKKKYFRIWSYSGDAVSFHRTVAVTYTVTVTKPTLTNGANCGINVTWGDQLTCPTDSILLLAGNHIPYGPPSGILNIGDTVKGGALVIYKGRGNSYNYTTDLDSNIYIQKWNFTASHIYSNVADGTFDFVSKPNAITAITTAAVSKAAIKIDWQALTNSCFPGDQYILAYSQDGIFGNPSGAYTPGDMIIGGGTVIYAGPLTSFTHQGLVANTGYCYRVWKLNNNRYSFGKASCGRTLCENSAINLPYAEGFNSDNGSLPDICKWTVVNNTKIASPLNIQTGSQNPVANPVEGIGMLRFYAYNIQKDQNVMLLSAPVVKGAGTSMDIRFRWYQDSSNYTGSEFENEGVTVQWSNDKAHWTNLEFYPRVPVNGMSGWSYKQLTLPDAAKPLDTVYVAFRFNSGFGNNCYLDDLRFQQSAYKPSDGITRNAATEFTDSSSGWTHYYDTTGDRLLSINKKSQLIGKAGQAGFTLKVGGDAASTFIPHTPTNYVLNVGKWLAADRYYQVYPVSDIKDTAQVMFYFSEADIAGLTSKKDSLLVPLENVTIPAIYAYHINDLNGFYNCDPQSGHGNVPQADAYNTNGFHLYGNSPIADTGHWQNTNFGNGIFGAIYTIAHLGGGGIGIGTATKQSALPVQFTSFTVTAFSQQVLLNWKVANENGIMYYEVAYSTDGNNFETIGSVTATVGASEQNYSFTHILPNRGTVYYQIKAVTSTNRIVESEIINLSFKAGNALLIRPNPAHHITVLQSNQNMKQVNMYDAKGILVMCQKITGNVTELNIAALANGVYFITVFTEEGNTLHQKLLKQ